MNKQVYKQSLLSALQFFVRPTVLCRPPPEKNEVINNQKNYKDV